MSAKPRPYFSGLDGLRGLAVIAVLLYHTSDLAGGYLGVEVFFVLSGYLVTLVLLHDWQTLGHVNLTTFWLHRMRRLLPASLTVILATLVYCVLFLPHEVANVRGPAVAAVFGVTNWYYVLAQESYFQAVGRPPLLQHFWSLGVEWQFYLVWAVVLALGLGRLGTRWLVGLALLGAIASAAWMAALYQPDADPSRLYYGTDTRATGLLLGSALALAQASLARTPHLSPLVLDGLGLLALGALAYLCVRLDEFEPFLYRGGFAVVGLATSLTIMAAINPSGRLGAGLLGRQPLRWVGLRSYSIYLWHWPIFMVTRPQLDIPLDGPLLLALRLALVGLLAELSYRYVEVPCRTGALTRAWQSLCAAYRQGTRRLAIQWTAALGSVLAGLVVLTTAVAAAPPPQPPAYLAVQSLDTWGAAAGAPAFVVEAPPGEAPVALPAVGPGSVSTGSSGLAARSPGAEADTALTVATRVASAPTLLLAAAPPPTTVPTDPTQPLAAGADPTDSSAASPVADATDTPAPAELAPLPAEPLVVTAIGDSVMLGAASALQDALPGIQIDAEVGRQVSTAIQILAARKAAGQLGDVVVVHMGNNGTFTADQFDQMMGILGDVPWVIFVNVKVPRAWEEPNNAVLAAGVQRYPQTILVDWYAESVNQPSLFWDDGIHLQPEGAALYAQTIADEVSSLSPDVATPSGQ